MGTKPLSVKPRITNRRPNTPRRPNRPRTSPKKSRKNSNNTHIGNKKRKVLRNTKGKRQRNNSINLNALLKQLKIN